MRASNLVPVVKNIESAGKAFTRRYWVKPEEAKQRIKERGYDQAMRSMGGSPESSVSLVSQWSDSSTETPGAAVIQARVGKIVGVPKEQALNSLRRQTPPDVLKLAEAVYEPKVADGDATLQALSAMSQSMYPEETVTLYRGIGGKTGAAIADAKRAGKEVLDITMRPATSFSESETVARRFTQGQGVVIAVKVPRSAILMTHRLKDVGGPRVGIAGEEEVVVMSKGAIRVSSSDVGILRLLVGAPPMQE